MLASTTYKVLHLSFVFLFFMLATSAFFLPQKSKKLSAAIGIVGFLILVAGMGLVARLGITWDWPLWLKLKLALWFILLGGAHMIAKRVRQPQKIGIAFLFVCGLIAAALAIYQP